MDVKALLFDVGGSVFDWQSAIVMVLPKVMDLRLRNSNHAKFAKRWREQSLIELAAIADQTAPWRPFERFINTSLDVACSDLGISDISLEDRAILLGAWYAMPVWPEVPEAVARLRSRYLVLPHTILGLGQVSRSSKAAGVTWDGIISCDGLGVSKTNQECYRRAAEIIALPMNQICYVAAHASDLWVARKLGMYTAFVESRIEEFGEDPHGTDYSGEFDLLARNYSHLADLMT